MMGWHLSPEQTLPELFHGEVQRGQGPLLEGVGAHVVTDQAITDGVKHGLSGARVSVTVMVTVRVRIKPYATVVNHCLCGHTLRDRPNEETGRQASQGPPSRLTG
jgi:hypothetical protein